MDYVRQSYLVRALLAGGVLFYALRLSAGDRGIVDFVVVGLVCAVGLFFLWKVGFALNTGFGMRGVWHLTRTATFWLVGIMNTALIRPEHIGTYRHWIGWVLLALAVFDSIVLIRKEREARDSLAERG